MDYLKPCFWNANIFLCTNGKSETFYVGFDKKIMRMWLLNPLSWKGDIFENN